MIDIASKEKTLTSRQCIELFAELGHPIPDHEWYNAVSRGQINSVSRTSQKRFARADVVALIAYKKRIAGLLTLKQVAERIREHLPTAFQHSSQVSRLKNSGRIKPAPDIDGEDLFEFADVDELIPQLIREEKERLAADRLMASKEAWNWINARLAVDGHEDRTISLDLFYHWVGNEKIPIDRKVPGKNGKFLSWRFSEESLLQAPCFNVIPEMPEVEQIVDITSTRQIPEIEAAWGGELVTKRGIKEEGVHSYHAVSKKKEKRRVHEVAHLGNNILFPKAYIPLKQRRRPKEDIDLD